MLCKFCIPKSYVFPFSRFTALICALLPPVGPMFLRSILIAPSWATCMGVLSPEASVIWLLKNEDDWLMMAIKMMLLLPVLFSGVSTIAAVLVMFWLVSLAEFGCVLVGFW